jgi:hypothetical protein
VFSTCCRGVVPAFPFYRSARRVERAFVPFVVPFVAAITLPFLLPAFVLLLISCHSFCHSDLRAFCAVSLLVVIPSPLLCDLCVSCPVALFLLPFSQVLFSDPHSKSFLLSVFILFCVFLPHFLLPLFSPGNHFDAGKSS